ncbi:MAG: D-aminoacylase [Lachnospiraceae bacterium]|jgi:N-acyl-D-amino-acid deacylase|nr:D-aminoacylase [Lachnospiraceae bacterium]
MYQYIFRGGLVIDGTGSPGYTGDVAILGDKIAKVAPQIDEPAEQEVDARGMVVCPGFIDVHSHSDISLLYHNNPDSKIYQGITTEVTGNCGFSPFPLKQEELWLKRRRTSLAFIDVDAVRWDWEDFAGYTRRMQTAKPNVNLVPLVGYGSIRAVVMGYENRRATKEELEEMCRILEEHFLQGVAGVSTGLGYPPDFYGDERELTEIARVAKRYGRIFAFHVRGERATLFRAVEEVISIGRNSGAKVHISHLKCAGIHNRKRSQELLDKIDEAVAQGVDLTFDMYPYTAGSSNLGLVFPPDCHEGGVENLLTTLKDPLKRAEIQQKMEQGTKEWSTMIGEYGGENLMVTALEVHKECIGKRIAEIGRLWGCSPSEAACRLMEEESGKVEMVIFQCEETDMDRIGVHPGCLYGTDGLAMGGRGKEIRQMPHPRYYGGFPLLISLYGGTEKGMELEELISRMTEKAAQRFGICRRGRLAAGYYGDVAVFDIKKLQALASYEEPCQVSQGIGYLMVNGCMEIWEGRKTERTKGELCTVKI